MSKKHPTNDEETEIRFLEAIRRRCPDDDRVWRALAELYTRVGRFEEGFYEDKKLADAFPTEPDVWYNLACSHALLGEIDAAFAALHKAIACGYGNIAWMQEDDDLSALWDDPRFQQLVNHFEA